MWRLFKFRKVQLCCTHHKINLTVNLYVRVQNLTFNKIYNSIQSQKYMFGKVKSNNHRKLKDGAWKDLDLRLGL